MGRNLMRDQIPVICGLVVIWEQVLEVSGLHNR